MAKRKLYVHVSVRIGSSQLFPVRAVRVTLGKQHWKLKRVVTMARSTELVYDAPLL